MACASLNEVAITVLLPLLVGKQHMHVWRCNGSICAWSLQRVRRQGQLDKTWWLNKGGVLAHRHDEGVQMSQNFSTAKVPAEAVVRDIRRAINQSINKFMPRRRISEKVSGRRNEFFADFFGGYASMKPRFF
jgi:hypothetical protein